VNGAKSMEGQLTRHRNGLESEGVYGCRDGTRKRIGKRSEEEKDLECDPGRIINRKKRNYYKNETRTYGTKLHRADKKRWMAAQLVEGEEFGHTKLEKTRGR